MEEIEKIQEMLKQAGIPFEVRPFNSWGIQVCYPSIKNRFCDIVYHRYSNGYEEGLLAIQGLLTKAESDIDSELGYLTAEDIFKRIRKHYCENNLKVGIKLKCVIKPRCSVTWFYVGKTYEVGNIFEDEIQMLDNDKWWSWFSISEEDYEGLKYLWHYFSIEQNNMEEENE